MGYCYETATGRLCCDICDKAGGVRKYRCPFGYCQAIALCPKCKKEHPEYTNKAGHRKNGCEKRMIQALKDRAKRVAIIERGGFVRCAALSHDKRPGENVKVIFVGKNNAEKAFWMSLETYHSIPYLVNATPEDYRRFGPTIEASNINIYDAELAPVLEPVLV